MVVRALLQFCGIWRDIARQKESKRNCKTDSNEKESAVQQLVVGSLVEVGGILVRNLRTRRLRFYTKVVT